VSIRAGAKRPAQYLQPPNERGFKRVVNIDLEDPRFDPVFAYAVATGPDRPVQDGIRDLLLQATAEIASNPAILAARQQALAEARVHVAKEIWAFLNKLAADLRLAPIEGEPIGVQAGNLIESGNSIVKSSEAA
jgi:hypothetical protein